MKNKEQSQPSSVGPAVHHQTLQASSSFPPPHRKPLDRPVSKIPQRALHKFTIKSKFQTNFIQTFSNVFKFQTFLNVFKFQTFSQLCASSRF